MRRSRRRSLIDYAFALVGLFPYRCAACLHRFRHYGNTLDQVPSEEEQPHE